MLTGLTLALGAVVGWLAKDLTGRWFSRVVARSGRVGYVRRDYGFFCEVTTDGRKFLSRYDPDNTFIDERVHTLRCSGDLYNDSDVAIMLTKPSVTFWNSDGLVATYGTPRLIVAAEEPTVITVPSHDRIPIVVLVEIHRDDLQTLQSTLPVLQMNDINGRDRRFRLSSTSFYGELAVWPLKGKLPTVLIHHGEDNS